MLIDSNRLSLFKSGKWYCEFKLVSGYDSANSTIRLGICRDPNAGFRASNNDKSVIKMIIISRVQLFTSRRESLSNLIKIFDYIIWFNIFCEW